MEFINAEKPLISKEVIAGVNNLPKRHPRFMLDRDQIFYSRSFRRLAGKTQLLAAGKDEILRTRLTHTLEVSQIARSIGQALELDLDLLEAIVLGHDLGHTPFGHVGERTLHEIMTPDSNHLLGKQCLLCRDADKIPEAWKPFLGFKHNLQSLVVTMELEKNARGRGLGLTKYTLYGLQAHTKPAYKKGRMKNHDMLGYYEKYLKKGTKISGREAWSLEALLVAQADEIAQWHHDFEDALWAGLVSPQEAVQVMNPMLYYRQEKLSPEEQAVLLRPESCDLENFIYVFTRVVVRTLMEALTEAAAERILAYGGLIPLVSPGDAKNPHVVLTPKGEPDKDIFSFGDKNEYVSLARAVEAFSEKIGGSILQMPQIQKSDEAGRKTIIKLFKGYYKRPEKLPDECLFAFFGACHELEPGANREKYERDLQEDAAKNGMESLRRAFAEKFRKRSQTTDVEELLLMRTICNHIASMTDADARRAARQRYI
jgi:dGTPase